MNSDSNFKRKLQPSKEDLKASNLLHNSLPSVAYSDKVLQPTSSIWSAQMMQLKAQKKNVQPEKNFQEIIKNSIYLLKEQQ